MVSGVKSTFSFDHSDENFFEGAGWGIFNFPTVYVVLFWEIPFIPKSNVKKNFFFNNMCKVSVGIIK